MIEIYFEIDTTPDFNRLKKVLTRSGKPDRIPFFEHFSDIEEDVLRYLDQPVQPVEDDMDKRQRALAKLKNHICYQQILGYDYINAGAIDPSFPRALEEGATGMTMQGKRIYKQASSNVIADRGDFQTYPWPEVDEMNFVLMEAAAELMPEGMRVVSLTPGGVLENTLWLLGFEQFSYLFFRGDRSLVEDIFKKVGETLVEYVKKISSFKVVAAVEVGDDMGFKSGPLVSPSILRDYVFPWHEKIVDIIHRRGKLAILHSCGNLDEIRDDIITCGWDGKHSFQDAIEPIWQAKKYYQGQLTVLGGFDMDKLSRMNVNQVKKHTRKLIELTAQDGYYALGSGNSVADYIPIKNFLTMLHEGFNYSEHNH